MIIRARPKYLESDFFDRATPTAPPADELFFNQGRAALKFCLEQFSRLQKKPLLVAMQSFNCEAVIEAALQAGCHIILVDIRFDDFSMPLEQLTRLPDKPDVLLLTHYQGIPNRDYEEIAGYCSDKQTLLIDDVAQTVQTPQSGFPEGPLSSVQMHSFAFDKPFTTFEGGSITIRNVVDDKFREVLESSYRGIETESDQKALVDLRMLRFLLAFTDEENYHPNLNDIPLIRTLTKLNSSDQAIYKIIRNQLVSKLSKLRNRFFRGHDRIDEKKLHDKKKDLVQHQRGNYQYRPEEVRALEKFLSNNGCSPETPVQTDLHWNRYSLLDRDGRISKLFLEMNVESGCYNWPRPLDVLYRNEERVTTSGSMEKTHIASKTVMNIPIWSTFFRRLDDQ